MRTNGGPNWSSDGQEIVYSRRSGRNNLDVWVMDADRTNPHHVAGLTGPGKYAEDCCASFSADDASVIFPSNRAGNFDIYRQVLRGPGKLVRLTRTKWYEGTPDVEAGGTVLCPEQQRSEGPPSSPFDPSQGARLVPTRGMVRTPSGSPDV